MIQKQLGHKDLRMTSRYAHVEADHVREAVNALNTILSDLKATEAEMRPKENRVTRLN